MNISDLISIPTYEEIKSDLLAHCAAAQLKITSWIQGDPADQILTVTSRGLYALGVLIQPVIKSGFLAFATDPGDPDPITGESDGSTPAPGWLSAKGLSDFGTPRTEEVFANGFVTLTNSSATLYTFGPQELTFGHETSGKTYRNSAEEGVGRYSLVASGTLTIPIEAEVSGSASNAAPDTITVMVSTLPGVTVTNAAAVLGSDRETADHYRARCRQAQVATSPNGPADAYRFIATSAREDGSFGAGANENSPALGITKVYAKRSSVTGDVDVYFASDSGPADSDDFDIVDDLIQQYAVADCVTYTGHIASGTSIAITYSVWVTSTIGVTTQVVEDSVAEALAGFFAEIPISGFDVIDGVGGTVYSSTLNSVIARAHPKIYRASIAIPAGNVAITEGNVATLGALTPTVNFS